MKRGLTLLFFLLVLVKGHTFYIPPPPPPTPNQPAYSEHAAEEIPKFLKRHEEEMNARDHYELGLLYLQVHNNQTARLHLIQATKLNQWMTDAWLQLGYLDLWEDRYDDAYLHFFDALYTDSCNKKAIEGLIVVGKRWIFVREKRLKTERLFKRLYECEPRNPDVLLHYARLLIEESHLQKAELLLRKALLLAPTNPDVALSLISVYSQTKDWSQAQKVAEDYLKEPLRSKQLALIAKRQGNLELAAKLYEERIRKGIADDGTRLELARLLATQRKYVAANRYYRGFLQNHPGNEAVWREFYNIRTIGSYTWDNKIRHTVAYENDPALQAPVVRTRYMGYFSTFHLPFTSDWVIDLLALYYNQKEFNTFSGGLNYNALLSGGQILSRFYFSDSWQWNAYLRALRSWRGEGIQAFPYRSGNYFLPGTTLIYDSRPNFISFDANMGEYLIKNFTTFQSYLLRTSNLKLFYLFRPEVKCHPEIDVSIAATGYKGMTYNWSNREEVGILCGFPIIENHLKWYYRFRHEHFSHLSQNYFSYNLQYLNRLGTKALFQLTGNLRLTFIYERNWQYTKDFIQPIGAFLFIADKQFLTGSQVSSELAYRIRDCFRAGFEAGYVRNTLPYTHWFLNGSLHWNF